MGFGVFFGRMGAVFISSEECWLYLTARNPPIIQFDLIYSYLDTLRPNSLIKQNKPISPVVQNSGVSE